MAKTDISLEPLFNQSAEGVGSNKKVAFVPVNLVGIASNRTPIEVSSTRRQITITAGNRTIELQNTGAEIIYYGGSGVTSSTGIKLFPNSTKIFSNVQDTFSVYLVADGSDTPECRMVEYT